MALARSLSDFDPRQLIPPYSAAMRQAIGCFGLVMSVGLVMGCGGAPKPATTAKGAAPPVVVAPAQVDMSPVAEPEGMIAIARFERPWTSANEVASWIGVPLQPQLLDHIEAGLSKELVLDAPLEAAVVLGPGVDEDATPRMVFSIGASTLEGARSLVSKATKAELHEVAPSVWLPTKEDPDGPNCGVSPALGKAPVRIVCGSNLVSVRDLIAFAGRGLPLTHLSSSALHIEFRPEPLRARFGTQLRAGKAMLLPMLLSSLKLRDPRFERPLSDLAQSLGDEVLDVVDDLDRINIDFDVSKAPDEARMRFGLQFRSKTSFTAQLSDSYTRSMRLPPAAWRELPADAMTRSWSAAGNAALWAKPAERVRALLDGLLATVDAKPALRDKVANAYANILKGQPVVVGASWPAADASKDPLKLGESASLIEEGPERWSAAFAATSQLLADKALRKVAETKLGLPAAFLLSFDKVNLPKLPPKAEAYRLRLDSSAMDWAKRVAPSQATPSEAPDGTKGKKAAPAGAQKGKAAKPVAPVELLLVLVPEGQKTWILMGSNPDSLRNRLTSLTSHKAPPARALPGFDDRPALSGTVMTVAALLRAMLQHPSTTGNSQLSPESVLATLPAHGETPLYCSLTAKALGTGSLIELGCTVPKAALTDMAVAVPVIAAQ